MPLGREFNLTFIVNRALTTRGCHAPGGVAACVRGQRLRHEYTTTSDYIFVIKE
jgi:hypothetical protein